MKKQLLWMLLLCSTMLSAQSSMNDMKRSIYQNTNSIAHQNYIGLLNKVEELGKANIYFAFEDWQQARINYNKGEELVLDSVNYHILDNKMFFYKNGKLYFLFGGAIEQIEIGDKVYQYLSTGEEASYFEVLVDGILQLLRKQEIVKQKITNNPLGIADGPQVYEEKLKAQLYYNFVAKSKIAPIPRKKKQFLQIFPSHRNKVLQFIRTNKVSNKSVADLSSLFHYYNQL